MKTDACVKKSIRRFGRGLAGCCLVLAAGCTLLRPEAPAQAISAYALNAAQRTTVLAPSATQSPSTSAITLLVSVPQAVAGFDSKRLIYVRRAHKLEYFANSEWIDTPARMLFPRVVAALEKRAVFRAIVHPPGSASGDLRLDTEVVVLQQEFDGVPSRVRFVLRAVLVGDASRQVVATREFEAVVAAASDDAYGGVVAANAAVDAVLEQLADFCEAAAKDWRQ